jgi:diguanylate cyclase (GGDEF)-like protein/PAS domain S-box-containing protein
MRALNSVVQFSPEPIPRPPLMTANGDEFDGFALQRFISSVPVPLLVLDRNLRCVAVNDAMAGLFGASARTTVGSALHDIFPESLRLADRCLTRLRAGARLREREFRLRGCIYRISVSPMMDRASQVTGIIVAAVDLTRRAQVEERLRRSRQRLLHDAHHDHLTGLLNRRGLDDVLRRRLERTNAENTALSVIMADIDWFKAYNDAFGHIAGDKCLQRIATAIRSCVDQCGGVTGRYGGEEFVAILPGDVNAAKALAECVRKAVSTVGIDHPTSSYGVVTLSLGVASSRDWPGHQAGCGEKMMRLADEALYAAKAKGRNCVWCAEDIREVRAIL